MDIYSTFEKYRNAMRKMDIAQSEKLRWFHATVYCFLGKFDWILSYSATDILGQEKRGDTRFSGVCYDACEYLARKLAEKSIENKAYWICGYDKKSIKLWFAGQSLDFTPFGREH